jgi:hypothetical protein
LPDGRWLVVGARSHYRESGPEENAVVYGPSGQQVASFCMGDGINDVQTTPSGQVWVSYGDEGVFGNFGWGMPGPEPLGRSGLARWSPSGERTIELEPPEGLSVMADCYALNMIGEDAWACYYPDFPIVHVSPDGSTRGWATGASGPHALAVDTTGLVGIVGGYSGLFDKLVVAELTDNEVAGAITYKLVMPDLAELPVDARVLARGHCVHVVTGGRWLQHDISRIER